MSGDLAFEGALAALSELPARSGGRGARALAEAFLEPLRALEGVDVAYARLEDTHDEGAAEAAWARGGAPACAAEIRAAIAPLLGEAARATAPDPLGRGYAVRVVTMRLAGEAVLAATSERSDFPSPLEAALLRTALNQLVLARLLSRPADAPLSRAAREDAPATRRDAPTRYETLSSAGIVGQSRAIRDILSEVALVAPTEATVLILGDSGTGKELLAREIHERSQRAGRALVKVNCSAIPREMFESEFFGHVRGAFTGAVRDRPGRFQLAERGSLFLDEVGDLPLDLQPKLLRVLQEGQYERVGEDVTRTADVRVIAATNRDLRADVSAGRFREDLYYRLTVFPLRLPPLRERKEDIVPLAAHFIALASKALGRPAPRLTAEQRAVICEHDWPGNIRELQNVVERAVILSRGGELRIDRSLRGGAGDGEPSAGAPTLTSLRRGEALPCEASPPREEVAIISDEACRRCERANMMAALTKADGRIYGAGGAAELLGVKPSTLQSRLRALGIRART